LGATFNDAQIAELIRLLKRLNQIMLYLFPNLGHNEFRETEDKPMARVLKSDDSSKIMVLDDGFVASFESGKWVPGARFNSHELNTQFRSVQNKDEAQELTKQARAAVQQYATA
jgi:hypothetical protein